jgi:hypothetical protein
MTETPTVPGRLVLRDAPAGLPDPHIHPPTVAETGDPFAAIRVVDLLARVERGRPVRVADIAHRLDASYLDWLFPAPVVTDVIIQLQADWMADYRNASGIVVEDGPWGPTVTIEDTSRVDPWIVGQASRLAAECRERLVAFGRQDRPSGDG